MNPPLVYMYSPSWTLLPPPSPYHPSGLSQCASPKHPCKLIFSFETILAFEEFFFFFFLIRMMVKITLLGQGMVHMEIIKIIYCFQMTQLILKGVWLEVLHEESSNAPISLRVLQLGRFMWTLLLVPLTQLYIRKLLHCCFTKLKTLIMLSHSFHEMWIQTKCNRDDLTMVSGASAGRIKRLGTEHYWEKSLNNFFY